MFHLTVNSGRVGIPSYRFDLSIEEDLIEEVARVYGYNSIQAAPPAAQLRMTERKKASLVPINWWMLWSAVVIRKR